MKEFTCKSCGSNDLYEKDGFFICRYCGAKFLLTNDDKPAKESVIDLKTDVERLLQRCREEPSRAKKCAERILEIDPNNEEAKRILGIKCDQAGGCYIATAVYGSYDCPQVWTLRRYRDNILAGTWCGRLFVAFYYAVSPILVKRFGKTQWFKNMWKPKLDRMVERLNEKGVADTPYQDRQW